MVNNLVFRWPKPLFFMVLGAHGIQYQLEISINLCLEESLYWHKGISIVDFERYMIAHATSI